MVKKIGVGLYGSPSEKCRVAAKCGTIGGAARDMGGCIPILGGCMPCLYQACLEEDPLAGSRYLQTGCSFGGHGQGTWGLCDDCNSLGTHVGGSHAWVGKVMG